MEKEPSITLQVVVQPGSSVEKIEIIDSIIKIKVHKPAVDGAANKRLLELLAKKLNIAKTTLEIVKGEKSKHKVIKVFGITQLEINKKLILIE